VVAIGVLLFVNAFWNGGVSVFVCVLFGVMEGGPEGAGWWGMFVFLIPFVVIGLVMFAGLLLTLLEPLRRTSIQVGQSSITYRLTWFGVGPSWDYPIESLDRIEVKNKEAKQKRSANNATIPWKTTGATFRLSFVDRSNREVCSIDGLTEGEARWMAAAIEKERPVWFR
jgi:hypothetical protein